jgi:hypothetical protein
MVCFRYVIVNTLHKGDDNNNNNNNNNNFHKNVRFVEKMFCIGVRFNSNEF